MTRTDPDSLLADADPRAGVRTDLLLITAGWVLLGLIVRPFQNTPFIDDWVYAWSVERLLQHGGLWLLDYSGSLNPVQILWGALFCLPGGFSFTALRLSTFTLGLPCLIGLYLTLRELGVPRPAALIGTASLGVYPVFFILCGSFMTDVPMLAAMTWAGYATIRAIRRESDRSLMLAVVCACLAVGVRIVGAVVPVAMMLTLLMHAGAWGRRRLRFLWPIVALLFLGLLMAWHAHRTFAVGDLTDVPNAPANRIRDLKEYGLRFLPLMTISGVATMASALGIALLPLTLSMLRRWRWLATVCAFAALLAMYAFATSRGQRPFYPLTVGSTWSVVELGAAEPLLPDFDTPVPPAWLGWSLMTVAFVVTAGMVGLIVRRRYARGEPLLIWMIAGHLGLISILWLFYDRYALVLIPPLIVLLLTSRVRPSLVTAAPLLVGMALISIIGTRDHLAFNRALWSAVQTLQDRGTPVDQIDGGYVTNGWLQYAHPEHAPHDEQGGVRVPRVNGTQKLRYQIAGRASEGKVILRVPYKRWLSPSGEIVVTDRATVTNP